MTVSLRLRPAAVVRLDEIAMAREVSRSQVLREAVAAVVNGPLSPLPAVTARQISVPAPGRCTEKHLTPDEVRDFRWLNDFAEKCYLAGEPVKVGMNLDGLRFALSLAEDPDLAIP